MFNERKVYYQYEVTYYKRSSLDECSEVFSGSHIVWKDILTDKLYRHDGPCVVSQDPYLCINHNQIVQNTIHTISTLDNNNYLTFDLSEKIGRWLLSYHCLCIEKPLYQYIVTYYTIGEYCVIKWEDVLTGEVTRHDGPADVSFLTFLRENDKRDIYAYFIDENSTPYTISLDEYCAKYNCTNPFQDILK